MLVQQTPSGTEFGAHASHNRTLVLSGAYDPIAEILQQAPELPVASDLERLFLDCVLDARLGGEPIDSAEQRCRIVALALQKPAELGLPIEACSCSELRRAVKRQKIAPGISERTIRRILQDVDLRPDRVT